jgi:hypothetical protein
MKIKKICKCGSFTVEELKECIVLENGLLLELFKCNNCGQYFTYYGGFKEIDLEKGYFEE